ncbi:MAG TPA: DUF979 domain-containing protein [Candidatus Acidoferrales bacterium]|nr:DUF979 domain-containing protein [Candidatus Acidoferrales bacterium]
MITAEWIYWLLGAFFFLVGVEIALDRTHRKRWTNAAFWCLLGASLCYGSLIPRLPAWLLGIAVIGMALIAGFGLTGSGDVRTTSEAQRTASAAPKGNALFIPALTIPAVTVLVSLGAGRIVIGGRPLLAPESPTLVGLGVATIVALVVALALLRPKPPTVALSEGRRLLESIGWAALLPQMLATLGLLFTKAGVGTQVGAIAQHLVPENSRLFAVIVYALGMAAFTIVMGNAFAAFPIMTAAIGWPLLVERMGAHPAPLFAIAMLSGFCGTLCTPMAANFNLVPPALLEMRDKYGQIKVQIPTAVALLSVNVAFMLIFPFR